MDTAMAMRTMRVTMPALRGEAARLAILRLIVHLNGLKIAPSYRDLARSLEMAKASVELHVKVLRRAGLMEPEAPLRATEAGIALVKPPHAE